MPVVELGPRLLTPAVSAPMAELIRAKHERSGVHIETGATVVRIDTKEGHSKVVPAGGRTHFGRKLGSLRVDGRLHVNAAARVRSSALRPWRAAGRFRCCVIAKSRAFTRLSDEKCEGIYTWRATLTGHINFHQEFLR